tara:strand:+ start:1287 stop:2204 length:918 start_codon:yes stop_codon:yes gene_type:complete
VSIINRKSFISYLFPVSIIFLGIVINEYVLTYLFSNDGILEFRTKAIIFLFQGFLILFGFIILVSEILRSKVFSIILMVKHDSRKIIIYSGWFLFIYTSSNHIYSNVINYIASNMAIRESFYFSNDVTLKGTHFGGNNFKKSFSKNRGILRSFGLDQTIYFFNKFKNFSPSVSNFFLEYQLVQVLYDLSSRPNSFKQETVLYIPKTLKTYWDMSCDSHMSPFIAPAISNIAMIEGLPFITSKTCYTHTLEYGYAEYYSLNKKATFISMKNEELCIKALNEGFNRVIEITQDSSNSIITINHECIL